MSIEPIGFATLAIGLLCLWLSGTRATVIMLVGMALLGSAAALFISSANIQPGHLFLVFLAIAVLTRRREATALIRALHPDEPGFWLASLVIYGVITAFLFPRLMAGMTDIVPLGSSGYEDTGFTVPLGPVSSNLTQSVYMVANLACFAMFAAVAATRSGFETVFAGLMAYAVGNAIFALLDLGTYSTGTQSLLEFIRNARYTLHTEAEVAGMKRIVGSFTEAAAFSRSSLGVLAFTGTLWICGYRPLFTGLLTLATLVLLVLSTSSAGLAGTPVVLALLYLTALTKCGIGPDARLSRIVVLAAPLVVLLVVLLILLDPKLSKTVYDYVDIIVLSKSDTDSGRERNSWNVTALQNIADSWGIGVGLGTVRTSNFALAMITSVGVLGSVFYLAFLGLALFRNAGAPRSFVSDARTAARNGCLALLIGDLLVSPFIDQGLYFYVLAAMAAARPEPDDIMIPTFDPHGRIA